ncbi:nocturnin-like [Arapaima gigas]
MYPVRLCSILQREFPALRVSPRGSPQRRASPSSVSVSGPSVCVDSTSSKASPASTVCSMGSSTSRLFSAIAQSLSSAPLAQAPPYQEQANVEPSDPDELLKECEKVLQNRPPRLRRSFVFPGNGSSHRHHFRVMQWNILAQALGEGKDGFVHCPPEALDWAERKYLILEEILTYRPDVLCLQEVDHYFDTFQPLLSSLGYHSMFYPKPWSPCLDVESNNGPDGCALFFRKERFELVDSVSLRLAAMMVKTNQVAIIQKLRCKRTGRLLCVAVTHLKARSGWERLRSAQGSDLLYSLQHMAQGTQLPVLVCGDFNAEPSEDVYRHFATSSLNLDSVCKLLSADRQSEPPYTTWKIRPSGESCHTLDYIWYSQHAFEVDAVLDFPSEEQIGPNRLPSYNYPSDHLSLICDISFKDDPDRLL